METMQARIDEANGKIEMLEDGKVLGFLEYDKPNEQVLRALHTETLPGSEGKGVGTALFNALVDFVQKNNWKVQPECSFIKAKMGKNEATKQLLAKEEDL